MSLTNRFWSRGLGLCAIAGCLIGAAQSTRGEVVTRQVNAMLTATPDGAGNTYNLDVDGDGVVDFTFTTIIGDPTDPGFASFAQITTPFASSNGAVVDAATVDGFPTVSRLGAGSTVGPSSTFSFVNDTDNLYNVDEFDPATGNFDNASGYVGLRFLSGGNTLYGFAFVTVNDLFAANDPLGLTIGEVGYETVPGTAVSTPEPVSLLAIAPALALVLARRKR